MRAGANATPFEGLSGFMPTEDPKKPLLTLRLPTGLRNPITAVLYEYHLALALQRTHHSRDKEDVLKVSFLCLKCLRELKEHLQIKTDICFSIVTVQNGMYKSPCGHF